VLSKDSQMAKEHMKIYLLNIFTEVPLVIWEMQIKTKMSYCYVPIITTNRKTSDNDKYLQG
jgi:hypothetical protein